VAGTALFAPNSRFAPVRNFLFAAPGSIAPLNRHHDPQEALTDPFETELAQWMTRGGDARIVLDPATGLNRYASAPYPREVLAFASSTANDISPEAHAFLAAEWGEAAAGLEQGAGYGDALEGFRAQIRAAYGLDPATEVFFAPSGTDLEYVGLLAAAGRRAGGIVNCLLGKDEVGSGCIHSAAGAYFADETALGTAVAPGQMIAGLPPIRLEDLPVRTGEGEAHTSAELVAAMTAMVEAAHGEDHFPLIHVVHGSKTGLVLPHLDDVDALRDRFGDGVLFVVDACQARITSQALRDYLNRGMIVFVTGSKFMGGPPFSGFALLPAGLAAGAAPVAAGMASVFRRAELPDGWPGRAVCEDSGNAGLALRLAASLFELDRFQQLAIERVARIVAEFTQATDRLAARLGARKVASAPPEDMGEQAGHPIEMLTLVTLDLCHDPAGQRMRALTFDDAARLHKALIGQDIRLGQPVRCVMLGTGDDGNPLWGATLRIGLSMPQVTRLDALDDSALALWFAAAMERIEARLAALLEVPGEPAPALA
jgi:hypothetical protein